MNAKITPSNKYLIAVDGKPLGEFSLISSWEGISLFRNDNGESLIVDGVSTVSNIFKSIFNSREEHEGVVVKISPGCLP